MEYEAHELSLAFPDMPADQFRRFVEDIKANGLNNPIVLFEGKILDGRHRYRACLEVGVNPAFREFMEGNPDESSHGDPVAYVQSENAARRQLTESQLAYSITHPNILDFEKRRARERMSEAGSSAAPGKVAPTGAPFLDPGRAFEKRKARERQEELGRTHGTPLSADRREGVGDPGRASEKLAEKAGVGRRSVERAIKVRENGVPELNEAVAKGEVSLNMAEKIVKLKPASQKRVMNAPREQIGDALREAMNRSDSATRRSKRMSAGAPPVQEQDGSAFVRKFLSGIERLAIICAEDGVKDGGAIATKFMDEMDWESTPLKLQFERAEPVIRALAIIQQGRAQKAA